MGPDGAVSWLYAHEPGPGGYPINHPEPLAGHRFCLIFHQVRHPLRVISSNAKVNLGLERVEGDWLRAVEPGIIGGNYNNVTPTADQSTIYAGRLWLLWNRRIEQIADLRYRIEDTPPQLVCALAQFPVAKCGEAAAVPLVEASTSAQGSLQQGAIGVPQHFAASWEAIGALDSALELQLRSMSARYG